MAVVAILCSDVIRGDYLFRLVSELDIEVMCARTSGQLEQILERGQVDGVIADEQSLDARVVAMLKERDLSVILVHHVTDSPTSLRTIFPSTSWSWTNAVNVAGILHQYFQGRTHSGTFSVVEEARQSTG